jgi:hypothetical protein
MLLIMASQRLKISMRFFQFNSDRYATPRPYGVEAVFHPLRLDVGELRAKRRQAAPVPKTCDEPDQSSGKTNVRALVLHRPQNSECVHAALQTAWAHGGNSTLMPSYEVRWPTLALRAISGQRDRSTHSPAPKTTNRVGADEPDHSVWRLRSQRLPQRHINGPCTHRARGGFGEAGPLR